MIENVYFQSHGEGRKEYIVVTPNGPSGVMVTSLSVSPGEDELTFFVLGVSQERVEALSPGESMTVKSTSPNPFNITILRVC